MKFKTVYKIGLIVILICILYGCQNIGDNKENETIPEYVFRYAENQPEGYPTTEAAYRFSELVYDRTNGKIKINVHSGGVLGDEVSVVEQLQYGGIDFARVSIMSMGDVEPKINILQMPYLYRDTEHMWAVLDGDIGQSFMYTFEDFGLKALAWYDAGTRHFYTREQVSCLEDLVGKKIRTGKSALLETMVESFGATPVPMDYSDIYAALELGEIYGAENNWASYEYAENYKVAKYMLLNGHIKIPELQIVSSATWNKLSLEDKEIIEQCAKEASKYQRELWKEQEIASREKLESMGVITTELSEIELEKFKKAVEPMYEVLDEETKDWIEKIRNIK